MPRSLLCPFHLSLSAQILINSVSRVPEPGAEDPLPLSLKSKTDPFSNEAHSFLLHFIIPPLVSLSLLLCVFLLAL